VAMGKMNNDEGKKWSPTLGVQGSPVKGGTPPNKKSFEDHKNKLQRVIYTWLWDQSPFRWWVGREGGHDGRRRGSKEGRRTNSDKRVV